MQIARLIYTDATSDKNWTCIREIQRTLQNSIRNLLTVPAIDLELDDGIHLSGKSQIILGRRLAEAAYTLTGGKDALPPPIELDSVKMKCLPKINEVQFLYQLKLSRRTGVGRASRGIHVQQLSGGFEFPDGTERKYCDSSLRFRRAGDESRLRLLCESLLQYP